MAAVPERAARAAASGLRRRPGRPRARSLALNLGAPLGFAVVVVGLWALLKAMTDIPDTSLPTPAQVFDALVDQRDLLRENAWVTIQEILVGFAAAIVLGIGLAVAIHSSKIVERAVYPWLVVSQMVPIVAIAPIFVIWTGFDLRPKVMVIALVAFFPLAVSTIDGLKAADPELLNLLRTLGAKRRQRFRMAQLPAALPFVFSGLKVAAALSVIGAVFGEWVGSSAGLGYLILTFNNQLATADMFATIIVLAVIGIALFGIVLLLERILLPWYHDGRRGLGE